VLFNESDYDYYLELLKEWCDKESVEIWAYCLMTNHVHLLLKPMQGSNLSKAIAETHRRYTRMINFRENWRGYLWQGRFSSYPMDEEHLLKVAAYVELNPVKAKMVKSAWDYKWSSVHAHLKGSDPLEIVEPQKLLELCGDWKTYLAQSQGKQDGLFESHLNTGRPLGDDGFINYAERILERSLRKMKPGPKKSDD
jgi:putative transposase